MAPVFRKSRFSNLEFGFSVVLGKIIMMKKPPKTSKSKTTEPIKMESFG